MKATVRQFQCVVIAVFALLLPPGMTLNLEASNNEAGWCTVQVEYTCAVTESGYEHLIRPDQRLLTLPLQ